MGDARANSQVITSDISLSRFPEKSTFCHFSRFSYLSVFTSKILLIIDFYQEILVDTGKVKRGKVEKKSWEERKVAVLLKLYKTQ